MRMLLLFDLPTVEKEDITNYNLFVKELKKIGFYRLQFSVYVKSLTNQTDYVNVQNKILKKIPKKGNIIILRLTDKQYNEMIYLSGEKNRYDALVGTKNLIYLSGEKNAN